MKALLAFATLALLFALPTRADQLVVYTLTSIDSPGGIGDFSWTLETSGFIQPPPLPTYDSRGNCTNCDSNLFTPTSSSAPSNGDGCQISKLLLLPDYAPVTLFAPLCDGVYEGYSGGAMPEPGVMGTFSWQWENSDGTTNLETLTISDPVSSSLPAVPEPRTWTMLLAGMGLVWLGRKIKL